MVCTLLKSGVRRDTSLGRIMSPKNSANQCLIVLFGESLLPRDQQPGIAESASESASPR